jgi:excisionase family DNA binding protein
MNDCERETYTILEAARILGVGRTVAYAAAASGAIPTLRIGRKVLVPRVALHHLLASKIPETEAGHRCHCCICLRASEPPEHLDV